MRSLVARNLLRSHRHLAVASKTMSCVNCGDNGNKPDAAYCRSCGGRRPAADMRKIVPLIYAGKAHGPYDFEEGEFNGKPCYYATSDELDRYESNLIPQLRFTDLALANDGYRNLAFQGTPVIAR